MPRYLVTTRVFSEIETYVEATSEAEAIGLVEDDLWLDLPEYEILSSAELAEDE